MYLKRLKELREERGQTYEQVGEIIGKDAKKYMKIENGEIDLKIPELIKVWDLYGVTADYLMELERPVK